MHKEFQLPSNSILLESQFLREKGVELFVKRDDLIHPVISGNKWRKLKYNIEFAKRSKSSCILTFGGAYSNHLIATAKAGQIFNLPTIGIVRGEEKKALNPTLQKCVEYGMQLEFVTRDLYKRKEEKTFHQDLRDKFGEYLLIPEGGANDLGIKGCEEILSEDKNVHDYVSVAAGTGTTAKGILKASNEEKILVFPALKGATFLRNEISDQIRNDKLNRLELFEDYHFDGYAKINPELIAFTRDFYNSYQIKLDLIYTAKHFFGLFDLIRKNYFPPKSKILAIHTGGLQGNKGMEERYKVDLFSF